ncbi:MAG: hypothetical protein HYY05_08385, partial [Chloroflexi bacterium]|nr:hypothetical protein [Chloroflexota bacterium]
MTEKPAPPLESVRLTNTYLDFQRSEGVPVIGGFAVDDLWQVELAPWPRKGGRGAYINLDGAAGTNDAYIVDSPPAGSLHPQRHLYEEMIFILEGNGSTS